MPLINPTDAHLSHIDAPPSEIATAAAHSIIQAETAPEAQTTLHPQVLRGREPKFSPSIEAEHARIASKEPKPSALDLARYEVLDAPPRNDLGEWRTALDRAYTSHEYLRGRETNLALLETYGKNAWLIANSQLEDVLKALQREAEDAKTEQQAVELARRAGQENARGEMELLEQSWREGVGRMIETQAANEGLRLKILEAKRANAR